MFCLISGMHFMTCLAASPLLSVDMKKMEVNGTVSEVCQLMSHFILADIRVVAFKAHCIFFRRVSGIKFCWKILLKKIDICRSMRFVTRVAVAFLYRSMHIFTGNNLFLKLFVAGKADIL